MGITEKKIAHLKELAQAAPDNEWFYEKRKDGEYELSCLGIKFFKSEARRYIAAANPETVLAIIAEIERLKRTLDYQIRFMAEYKRVAEIAWGGEIPSPLPGLISNEERWIAQMQYLNCPYCWGSGHIGDCENVVPEDLRERIEKMDREIESLEREAVFLSTKLVCASSPKECDFQGDHICDDCDKGRWNFHYWRNLAREFVSKYDTGNPAEEENE